MINKKTYPKIGDKVRPNFGPHRGCIATINKIEFDAGAKNGWFTVDLPNDSKAIYAGEELEVVQ